MKHGDETIDAQVFGDDYCGWTRRARALLVQLQIELQYVDIRASDSPTSKPELISDTGQRTQPWVFVRGKFVGGCQELFALAQSGELGRLLGRDDDDAQDSS